MGRKRILIIEDDGAIAENLILAFQLECFDSERFATGAEGISALQKTHFDLVILDVGLPDLSGFEVCKQLRKLSTVPIFFLTARSEEVDKIVGLEIGGDDYILKPFSPREVVARVKAAFRRVEGSVLTVPAIETQMTFTIDEGRRKIRFCGRDLDLSRIEYSLLKVLIAKPGMVFSRSQLMDRISDDPGMSLERTIDSHIKSLRAKLREVDSANEWIETHRGFGYALRRPE